MRTLLIIVLLLFITCVGIGLYFFKFVDNKTPSYQSLFKKDHLGELGDFPIYPQAKFFGKQSAIPCPSEYSGYSSCGETLYFFRTNAPAVDFFNFYHADNNGWTMSGGAGETDVGRHNYSGESSYKKGEVVYYLHYAASNGRVTEYIVGVPEK